MTARLLVRHQRRPDFVGIEIVAAVIEQFLRIGLDETRREALADQAALPVAAIRIETIADHRLAVAHGIGDDGDEARRHLREIDIGVADGRRDRFGDFADVDDTDGHGVWLSEDDYSSYGQITPRPSLRANGSATPDDKLREAIKRKTRRLD